MVHASPVSQRSVTQDELQIIAAPFVQRERLRQSEPKYAPEVKKALVSFSFNVEGYGVILVQQEKIRCVRSPFDQYDFRFPVT